MSLQLIAKQMEAKGRKGDSMLVHMTPGEVEGLQKLAENAGGSLTVNPETGLVEANFLKKLISSPLFAPLAGAGLMMIPGVGPMMAAGLVGGGTALATGDVGKGAMAGLSAFGGAGLAGGLGASAAGTAAGNAANIAAPGAGAIATGAGSQASMLAAQNAGFGTEGLGLMAEAAKVPASTAALNTAKAGISGLGSEAGRAAFMQGVGGVGGLAKSAGMAAAPMLTQEQKMAEAPVDDEMYSYSFDPGRTGAERNPMATSSEREYFRSGYSPMRKIRARDYAAQGGLMSLAEGGETTAPAAEAAAPSASEAALAYLMGERSSSSAGLPAMGARTPSTSTSNIGVGGDNMYAFDPATGTFLRNPNVAGAKTSGSRVGTSFAGSGDSDNAPMSQQTKDFFDNESFLQREARMGEVNNLFSLGPAAAFVNAMTGIGPQGRAPDFGTLIGKSDLYNNLSDENMRSEGGRGGYDNSSDRGGYDPSSGDVGGEGGRGRDGTATGGMGPSSARAQGGLIGLAKGGMASGGFVVPADVVSALGNGSTDAGLRKLTAMMGDVKPIKGKGDGLSDSIPTNIDGKQPARVADGEAYIDPKTVKRLGGAKKLYAMMDKVRAQAHGKTTQQRKVNPARVMA